MPTPDPTPPDVVVCTRCGGSGSITATDGTAVSGPHRCTSCDGRGVRQRTETALPLTPAARVGLAALDPEVVAARGAWRVGGQIGRALLLGRAFYRFLDQAQGDVHMGRTLDHPTRFVEVDPGYRALLDDTEADVVADVIDGRPQPVDRDGDDVAVVLILSPPEAEAVRLACEARCIPLAARDGTDGGDRAPRMRAIIRHLADALGD